MIEFDNTPASIRKPGVYSEYNAKDAVTVLPTNSQEMLIVAPMSKPTTTDFSEPVRLFSDAEAKAEFGAGSVAHLMVRQALNNNPNLRLTVIGLKDHGAGIPAVGKFTLSGAATRTGIITLAISGEQFSIASAKGDTEATLVNRLVAMINASELSPVIASLESNRHLKLTAKCKGEVGNEIVLAVQKNNSGNAITVEAMTGGQRNAVIDGALASVAGAHYHIIVSPFSDNENGTMLRNHLERLASPEAKKPAIGVLGFKGTMAAGTTFTGRLNSERLTVAWYKGAVETNGLIAAGYAAIIAKEEDPARPLNTLEIKGLGLVGSAQIPTWSEFNQALYNGLTPLEVVNGRVQILRAITTYTKAPTNTDDPSWLDLTTIRSMDYVRKAIEQRIELRFPRSKLNDRVAKKVRSEILDVLYRLQELEVVENVDKHKSRLIVERNLQDVNRLDTQIPADVVNGLHIVANRIDLIL